MWEETVDSLSPDVTSVVLGNGGHGELIATFYSMVTGIFDGLSFIMVVLPWIICSWTVDHRAVWVGVGVAKEEIFTDLPSCLLFASPCWKFHLRVNITIVSRMTCSQSPENLPNSPSRKVSEAAAWAESGSPKFISFFKRRYWNPPKVWSDGSYDPFNSGATHGKNHITEAQGHWGLNRRPRKRHATAREASLTEQAHLLDPCHSVQHSSPGFELSFALRPGVSFQVSL